MIVTRSWLNEWVDLSDVSSDELYKVLNSIGLEVDKIESSALPDGIVFGHVLKCEKHPDASKLSVCEVDVGSGVNLQIVCGAPNVKEGQDVVVATSGTTMPDGLVIKPVKLRGVESNGMICSAKELGLADINDGILELDSSIGEYKLGTSVNTNHILCDTLIEIELTANRGDCLNIRGVARDISAALDKPLLELNYKESDEKRLGVGRFLHISNSADIDVNLKYKVVEPKEFSLVLLLRLRLAQIGLKIENEIDALMRYITHSCGVLLKAYSYGFFENETTAQINLALDKNSLVSISNSKNEVASIAGLSQSDNSKATTKDHLILIEASYIDPEDISKKVYGKGVKTTDEYYKSSRGSESNLELGLKLSMYLLESYSDSIIYGGVIEHTKDIDSKVISFKKCDIEKIIGLEIDRLHINKILKNLGFATDKTVADNFVVSVPKHRHDIHNIQDIAEEILRIISIDSIPAKAITFSEQNRINSDYIEYKKRSEYRKKAANSGFYESIHFAFDERSSLLKYGFSVLDKKLELLNPIVNTLDTLRTTLLLSLLRSASSNAKNSYSSIRLFEIGSVFSKDREESLKLGVVFSGDKEEDGLLNSGKPQKVDFGYFLKKLSSIIGSFELVNSKPDHKLAHPFISADILIDGKRVGEVFRLHPAIEDEFDLGDTFMCEVEFDKLVFGLKTANEISRFQPSFRDLSLVVPNTIEYKDIKIAIDEVAGSEVKRYYPVDRYTDETLAQSASLTIRFMLQSPTKTFEEDDINSIMNSIQQNLNQKLGIELR
ncbi:MAG: phenylalanine--tRNA ligase subunit beta [Sulfurimonas sp.]|jgi:phenylalanyl-tRNA synthetase beta chain|nr:phenylalanine--tRNA ligase subunit beta [Sulfurimonadaceae bacterium]